LSCSQNKKRYQWYTVNIGAGGKTGNDPITFSGVAADATRATAVRRMTASSKLVSLTATKQQHTRSEEKQKNNELVWSASIVRSCLADTADETIVAAKMCNLNVIFFKFSGG